MTPVRKNEQKMKRSVSKTATASSVAAAAAQPRKRTPRKAASRSTAPIQVTPEERQKMIEQAAYFRAEKAGFTGDPHEHWLAAEKEVDAMLKAGIRPGRK